MHVVEGSTSPAGNSRRDAHVEIIVIYAKVFFEAVYRSNREVRLVAVQFVLKVLIDGTDDQRVDATGIERARKPADRLSASRSRDRQQPLPFAPCFPCNAQP